MIGFYWDVVVVGAAVVVGATVMFGAEVSELPPQAEAIRNTTTTAPSVLIT